MLKFRKIFGMQAEVETRTKCLKNDDGSVELWVYISAEGKMVHQTKRQIVRRPNIVFLKNIEEQHLAEAHRWAKLHYPDRSIVTIPRPQSLYAKT